MADFHFEIIVTFSIFVTNLSAMNTDNIIGRKQEIANLARLYHSDKSEFVAIYGRRRVGKSFLVDEFFRDEMCFSCVGVFKKDKTLSNTSYRKTQLHHFYFNLLDYGLHPSFKEPEDWLSAFELLKVLLNSKVEKRKIVFIDELPWLAGPQSSELIEELGYFWNNWAVKQRNILLIVCGSATSWMLNNVIRDYGGLHSRVTEKMYLKPFSLIECKAYYDNKGFHLSDYEVALSYMAIGGIPYYMDKLRPDLTISQNINEFFFRNESIDAEFNDVYTGLFQSADNYIAIVKALGRKFYGLTRSELIDSTGLKGGGTLSKMMENLVECGIIRTYPRYGGQRKEIIYQLCDSFTLFYLNFVDNKQQGKTWTSFSRTHEYESWSGRMFEIVCSQHIAEIKNALRIKSSGADYCWTGATPDGRNVQIDMLIPSSDERCDYVCEIKFSENKYHISSEYEQSLLNKLEAFKSSKNHKSSHSILLVMITSLGLEKSIHNRCVNTSLTLEDLMIFPKLRLPDRIDPELEELCGILKDSHVEDKDFEKAKYDYIISK